MPKKTQEPENHYTRDRNPITTVWDGKLYKLKLTH